MHWDHLFEDLEGQLASEWEAQRAALDAESERRRVASIELATRLRAFRSLSTAVQVDVAGSASVRGTVDQVGADWAGFDVRAQRMLALVPLNKIHSLAIDHGAMLASLDEESSPRSLVQARMTLGFVLRDLARRRVAVDLHLAAGRALHGTIDRAGADHLDIALHDAGEPRRRSSVHGHRIVPLHALQWIGVRRTDQRT